MSFDVTRVKAGTKSLVIGKRETGKSTLLRDIVHHNDTIPLKVEISPLETRHASDSVIHREYSPAIVQSLVDRQEHTIHRRLPDPRAIVILDQCMFDPSWHKEDGIKKLFTDGKRLQCTTILAMQYPPSISSELRDSVDFVFVMRGNTTFDLKRIYEDYCYCRHSTDEIFDTFDDFVEFVRAYEAEDSNAGSCLVIDRTAGSRNTLSYYKAVIKTDGKISL